MLIGELSKRMRLARDTIRYYEKLKLLGVEKRYAGNGYKDYGREALERLHNIRRLKEVGFTLREIRQLLADGGKSPVCKDLPAQVAQKLEQIDQKVAALLEFKDSLLAVQDACNGKCGTHSGIPTCIPHAGTPQRKSKCC